MAKQSNQQRSNEYSQSREPYGNRNFNDPVGGQHSGYSDRPAQYGGQFGTQQNPTGSHEYGNYGLRDSRRSNQFNADPFGHSQDNDQDYTSHDRNMEEPWANQNYRGRESFGPRSRNMSGGHWNELQRGSMNAFPGQHRGGMSAGYDENATSGEGQHHDPDYLQWRHEQIRGLDDDYRAWREERYSNFSNEFGKWRTSRKDSSSKSTGMSPEEDETSDQSSLASRNGGTTSSTTSKSK